MTVNRRSFIRIAAGGGAAFAAPAILRAAPGEADVALLRRAYETLHPGLYRYATPAQLTARFEALGSAFATARDLPARYLALSRLLGSVRCGHTYSNFYNQRRAVAETLFAGRNRLPFRFRWLGGRMIVTADTEGNGLAPGTEILAIDGRRASAILAALLPLARADGANGAKRRALLEVRGVDSYEAFDIYFPLLFPIRGADHLLALRTPAGLRRQLRVTPIDLARRRVAMRVAEPGPADNPGWRLEHRGRTAIMTTPTWALYDSTWDWQAWLTEGFEEMARRSSQALILDLRDNEGGADCGHAILARLIDAPLPLRSYERRVRFREAPRDLIPHLDTWDRGFDRLGVGATDLGNGFLRLPEEGGADEVIRPQGPRFRGHLVVLTGAQNSSATFQFAEMVRASRLGSLVGGATGGNRRGINGGSFYFLRLPESGLEADLPLVGTFPRRPQPDAGLLPDLAVEDRPDDIAMGRDAVLARALALIRS